MRGKRPDDAGDVSWSDAHPLTATWSVDAAAWEVARSGFESALGRLEYRSAEPETLVANVLEMCRSLGCRFEGPRSLAGALGISRVEFLGQRQPPLAPLLERKPPEIATVKDEFANAPFQNIVDAHRCGAAHVRSHQAQQFDRVPDNRVARIADGDEGAAGADTPPDDL